MEKKHAVNINDNGEVFTIKLPTDDGSSPAGDSSQRQYHVYKKRWLILAIFVIYSASNASQWIQYSIINNIISKFYHVSSYTVDWTSMIYMVTYIPLIFPASYILDIKGLRFTTIAGSFGTCAGSCIKAFAVQPNLFWLSFIGQTIVAISQIFILSIPARLAAVWFGPNEVSTACSIGVFGNQLGIAIGFILPVSIVQNHDDLNLIAADLKILYYGYAIFTLALFVVVLIFFSAAPPEPVSLAQAQQLEKPQEPFWNSIKELMKNSDYVKLLISYGMNVGVFYAISTLLNEIILSNYPSAEVDAGRIGLLMVVAGMLGSVFGGVILDKTHKFKETTLGFYVVSLLCMILYTFTLHLGLILVYFTSILLGFFMTGYLPVGFEMAAELTFPISEGTSAGILNAVVQVFGIALTSAYRSLITVTNDRWANITMCISLLLGTILTCLIRPNLKRQAALNS